MCSLSHLACSNYEEKDPKTHEGLNLEKMTAKALFEYYKLVGLLLLRRGQGVARCAVLCFLPRFSLSSLASVAVSVRVL